MPYIPILHELPGIIGLLETYTETGTISKKLANTLLNKETEAFNKSEKGIMDVYCFSNNIYCNVSGDTHFPFLYCGMN